MKPPLPDAGLKIALAAQAPEATPRSPDAFWEDFRRRAADLPRSTARPSRPMILFLAPLAAAAAVVLVAGIFFLRKDTQPPAPPVAANATGAFHAYEVFTPHTAVFILDAPASQGSILWVVGSNPGQPKEGVSL
jgi:hypothetical protein